MTLASLIVTNLWAKKARSIGIILAVALAVMTVVALVAVSSGLEGSAAQLITIGKSDFTVAQKGVSQILYSSIDNGQLHSVQTTPGVATAVGVLLETQDLNADNPLFIEIGIPPDELANFGVTVVAGRPFTATADHEVMLGWRAAQNFGVGVGGRFQANGTWNTVVGIYSTGISYGDLGAMFPLTALQTYNRVPGSVSLVFVKVAPGYPVSHVVTTVNTDFPELTTIQTAAQFGRADRDLVFLQAAATGSTVLAVLIGAVIVGNTMLLSLFERTRRVRAAPRHRLVTEPGGRPRRVGGHRPGPDRLDHRRRPVLRRHRAAAGPAGPARRAPTQLHPGRLLARTADGSRDGVDRRPLPPLRAANLVPLRALSHE